MRLAWMMGVAASSALSCCLAPGNPCEEVGRKTVIFAGRVLVDSGEETGQRVARMAVEEVLQNLPVEAREVEVDSQAGSGFYYRLKKGERYVVVAHREPGGRLFTNLSAGSFPLRGKEHLLAALREAVQGGVPRIVGTVQRRSDARRFDGGVAGATVMAEREGVEQEALTDSEGNFVISGIPPGRYRLSVMRDGFQEDEEFNRRPFGLRTIDAKRGAEIRETVDVGERGCALRDLAMWPDGKIAGTVRDLAGRPLTDVRVQAFGMDKNGERDSLPLRTAMSGAEGRYVIDRLPMGQYVVGVNAVRHRDEEAYPPVLCCGSTGLLVRDGEETSGADMVVAPKRTAISIGVKVIDPEGRPAPWATVKLLNRAREQRWYSPTETDMEGRMKAPGYQGEYYAVEAFLYRYVSPWGRTDGKPAHQRLRGRTVLGIAGHDPEVLVVTELEP